MSEMEARRLRRIDLAARVFAAMVGYSTSEESYSPSKVPEDFAEDPDGTWYRRTDNDSWFRNPPLRELDEQAKEVTDGKRYRYLDRPYEVRLAGEAVRYADALLAVLDP